MRKFKVLGLMSGTSLDGVDLALCSFSFLNGIWNFSIDRAETVPYSPEMEKQLLTIASSTAEEFALFDSQLGAYFGKLCSTFLKEEKVDLIASHGHTVFHQPEIFFTKQIGTGAAIYAATGIATACDFRSVDVFLGGQGAPLVPLGDRELFSQYDYRINLGGIANTSFEKEGRSLAYDICAVNQVFNYVAQQKGLVYDDGGKIASEGNFNESLYNYLNNLAYFQQSPPKSLGREWVEKNILNLVANYSLDDFQCTFAHHVAFQLAESIENKNGIILFSGGGAYNTFLMNVLQEKLPLATIEFSDKAITEFKEALIFAFLGLLGALKKHTSLASVTGAKHDSLSMALYGDFIQ